MASNSKCSRAIRAVKLIKSLEELEKLEKREHRRRFWVNPFLLRRQEFDLEANLLKDLLWDETEYGNFCRMSTERFKELLSVVENAIAKQDTNMRYSISKRNRLAITLRFIASGDSYRSLEFLTRVSRKTISKFVPEVLNAIYDSLQPTYMKIPSSTQEWLDISKEFNDIWWFPHTLGALDGKHIRITAPAHSGSHFYNFKGFFSIILFALVDAHSRFIYINVGANGKSSDSTIFRESYLYKALEEKTLNIPDPSPLTERIGNLPYFFIGDDAFGLTSFLMKPYNRNLPLTVNQKIFNYRICRARMCVEMAFGRLANRFRIFHKPIEVNPDHCDKIIKASCVLHNFLSRKMTSSINAEHDINADELPLNFSNMQAQNYNCYKFSNKIRDKLCSYCINEGNIPSQWGKI